MGNAIGGIHHVTAIATDPQRNVDFYADVLGLRFLKRTVNFDDPGSYHFYYGDGEGHPGTIMTFFAWPGAYRGQHGAGQITVTSFTVPEGSLGFWTQRLKSKGVVCEEVKERFGEEVLVFLDPDGLRLELIAQAGAPAGSPWTTADVAATSAVRSFHGVTLTVTDPEATSRFITEVMGFRSVVEDGARSRFQTEDGDAAVLLELLHSPDAPPGSIAGGTVHHVAWRVADDEAQLFWQDRLKTRGLAVTEVRDRQYFRSIYFREPSGVLFEIATDPPGFTRDEPLAELGQALKLPPWLEPRRAELEGALPSVVIP